MGIAKHLERLTTISARDHRYARWSRWVSNDLKAKGAFALKTTKVADEREQFAPKFWKTV
jgi:hypothetical protein